MATLRWSVPGTDRVLDAVAVDRLLALLAAPSSLEGVPDSLRWRVAQYLRHRPAFVVPPGFTRPELRDGGRGAARPGGWQAAVVCTAPLPPVGGVRWFEFTLATRERAWSGGVEVGFVEAPPAPEPKFDAGECGPWIIGATGQSEDVRTGETVPVFDPEALREGDRVRVSSDGGGRLRVAVNGQELGSIALGIPPAGALHGLVGMYGQCGAVSDLDTC